MILFVSIVHIVVCLMLVGIILLQPGRGMGLSGSALSDSSAQSVFGTKTADVLTKATTAAAILFMVTCVGLSALTARKSRSLYSDFKNQAPITMDQIQKAVKEAEKKTADQKASPAAAVAATASTSAATVSSAIPAAKEAVAPTAVPVSTEPKAA
jgi:preprotein translocase subunit SecG